MSSSFSSFPSYLLGMKTSAGLQGRRSEVLRRACVGAFLDHVVHLRVLCELGTMAVVEFSGEMRDGSWICSPFIFLPLDFVHPTYPSLDSWWLLLSLLSILNSYFALFLYSSLGDKKRDDYGRSHVFFALSVAWVLVLLNDGFLFISCLGKRPSFSFVFASDPLFSMSTFNLEARQAVLGRSGFLADYLVVRLSLYVMPSLRHWTRFVCARAPSTSLVLATWIDVLWSLEHGDLQYTRL